MVPQPASSEQVQPVALRVSDVEQSRRFFEGLFGLRPAPDFVATEDSIVLASPFPGERRLCIKLTTQPVPVPLSGVHIELETTNELLDLYFLALLGGFRIGELRYRRGSLSTTVTDPDGHTIEVEAYRSATVFTPTFQREPFRQRGEGLPGRDAGDLGRFVRSDEEPRRSAPDRGEPGRERAETAERGIGDSPSGNSAPDRSWRRGGR